METTFQYAGGCDQGNVLSYPRAFGSEWILIKVPLEQFSRAKDIGLVMRSSF
jgi:hypothetical protein